jgi:hypothetical protein
VLGGAQKAILTEARTGSTSTLPRRCTPRCGMESGPAVADGGRTASTVGGRAASDTAGGRDLSDVVVRSCTRHTEFIRCSG